jgi:hypothetical protein
MHMKDQVLNHIEQSLNNVRDIFIKIAEHVEKINPGERLPSTKLADEVGAELGLTGSSLYPIMRLLTDVGYPGIKNMKGRYGGLYRLTQAELDKAAADAQVEVADGEAESNSDSQ